MLVRARVAGRRKLKRFLDAPPEQRPALIDTESQRALELNWVAEQGFTMPNRRKYPWQWLWDSCFHSIAWNALDDERALIELTSCFAAQLPNG